MSLVVSQSAPQQAGMRYLRAYTFLLSTPHSFQTLTTLTVFFILPVVGQLVVWGYCYNLVERLLRRGEPPAYHEVTFTNIISRSAWPGVLMLPLYVSVIPFFFVFTWAATALSFYAAFNGGDTQAAVFGVAFPLFAVLLVVGMLIASSLLLAATLRMAMTQSILQGFNLSWLWEFWGKMWFELLLSTSFLWVTFVLGVSVGAMLFCVGILPAAVMCTLAQAHIQYQLYELYLRRGGTPIPIKPLPAYDPRYR